MREGVEDVSRADDGPGVRLSLVLRGAADDASVSNVELTAR